MVYIVCYQKAYTLLESSRTVIALAKGDSGEKQSFHFLFCMFLDCLSFLAKNSPIFKSQCMSLEW